MNEKNTLELFKDFPGLYRRENLDFGIETEDGWFDIIYDFSQKLMIVDPECQATQVKEKFGGLRFYTNGMNDEAEKLLIEVMDLSFITCEKCGKKGKERQNPWVKTLCDKCQKESNRNLYKGYGV